MLNLDKINKVSQVDFGGFNAKHLVSTLVEYRKAINILLLIGSLIWAGMIFVDYRSKAKELQAQLTREQTKLKVIDDYNQAVQGFKEFQSSLPKELNEFELADQISRDADQYHISLPSFNSAVPSKDMGIYDMREFGFSASADNFKDAMLFLRKIEKSEPPLRINSWSGRENADGTIAFDIDISAVHIHS